MRKIPKTILNCIDVVSSLIAKEKDEKILNIYAKLNEELFGVFEKLTQSLDIEHKQNKEGFWRDFVNGHMMEGAKGVLSYLGIKYTYKELYDKHHNLEKADMDKYEFIITYLNNDGRYNKLKDIDFLYKKSELYQLACDTQDKDKMIDVLYTLDYMYIQKMYYSIISK